VACCRPDGEVLEILVQRRRNRSAAVKLMRKLLRKQGFAPTRVTTDKLRSSEPFELQVWILIEHDLHNIANIDTARLQPASRRQGMGVRLLRPANPSEPTYYLPSAGSADA
jgi:putative transposase